MPKSKRAVLALLAFLPFAIVFWIWIGPLSFVPVPWPDDSAFYFVAKELFKWPPRWVMLPQAPFEPTYRIFNFNTMPLYPILIGLGRLVGIDGSHALKIWSLGFFAATGALLGTSLFRARLPAMLALIFTLGFALNPALRWASVLVRPESLIGLCGLALVLGLTLGFPRKLRPAGLWDPASALLAVAAYAHFNAIHLVFPVIVALISRPRKLFRVCILTGIYLVPWMVTVLWHPHLFLHQMTTQWTRLAVPNGWLSTVEGAVKSLFQEMGSPEPLPEIITWAGGALWLVLFGALVVGFVGLALPFARWALARRSTRLSDKGLKIHHTLNLAPSAAWVLGAAWLWHNKPEVWFTYYLQAALWTFASLATLKAWQAIQSPRREDTRAGIAALSVLGIFGIFTTGIFIFADFTQAEALSRGESWKWSTYESFVDCIDSRLTRLQADLGNPKPFRVWDPTFPDVTIELSRRHPDWELTRTNDFWERQGLAIQHGKDVEAVVVPETLQHSEAQISAPASAYPQIQSVWMNWKGYFLHRLYLEPGWKTERYLCQKGRWQAFLFMKPSQELPKEKTK